MEYSFPDWRTPKIEPIAWKKEEHLYWKTLALNRLKKYDLDGILLGTEHRPTALPAVNTVKLETGSVPDPTNTAATAAFREAALAHFRHVFDLKLATVTDFFYACMGTSGLAELRIRSDDLSNVVVSFENIDACANQLQSFESATLLTNFLNKKWKPSEQTFHEFRLQFILDDQRLQNAQPPQPLPDNLKKNVLLNIIKTHFKEYYPVYSKDHDMTVTTLLDEIETMVKSDARFSNSTSKLSSEERDISNAMAHVLTAFAPAYMSNDSSQRSDFRGSSMKPAGPSRKGAEHSSHPGPARGTFAEHFCRIHNRTIHHEHPVGDCNLYDEYRRHGGKNNRWSWVNEYLPTLERRSQSSGGRGPEPKSSKSNAKHGAYTTQSSATSQSTDIGFSTDNIGDAFTITCVEPLDIKFSYDPDDANPRWPLRLEDFLKSKHFHNPSSHSASVPVYDVNIVADAEVETREVDFVLDSGAVFHVTGDKSILDHFSVNHAKIGVRSANGAITESAGVGYVNSYLFYYVPGLVVNIISVPLICSQPNYKVSFCQDSAIVEYYPPSSSSAITFDSSLNVLSSVISPSIVELKCKIKHKLYMASLRIKVFGHAEARPSLPFIDTFFVPGSSDIEIWHRKLGHVSKDTLYKLSHSGLVDGLPKFSRQDVLATPHACPVCSMVKVHKALHDPNSHATASRMFEQISIDILFYDQGDMYLVAVDIYSKYKIIRAIENRANLAGDVEWILDTIETLRMENRHMNHGPVIFLKCDNEFARNADIDDLLRRRHITMRPTAAYSSFQNGPVERANQTIMNMAKCMLLDSGLSPSCFAYAMKCAVYVINRSYNKTANGVVIPYTVLTGKKPNLSNIHAFGQRCVYKLPDSQRSKADPRGRAARFVGYTNQPNAYYVRDSLTNSIRVSRDVVFVDPTIAPVSQWPAPDTSQDIDDDQDQFASPDIRVSSGDVTAKKHVRFQEEPEPQYPDPASLPRTGLRSQTRLALQDTEPRELKSDADVRSAHVITDAFDEPAYICTTVSNQAVPLSFEEAMRSSKSDKWLIAIKAELESMLSKGVFQYTDNVPPGKKLIKCRYVFRNKVSSDGQLTKEKARLVVKGYSQIAGLDFSDTYAPVAHMKTLRLVLFIIAAFSLSAISIDFVSAYLNAPLAEEIYMELPQGLSEVFGSSKYPSHNSAGKQCAMKLLKSLYGLKQSGRNWNQALVELLLSLGFSQHPSDASLLFRGSGKSLSMVLTYVDDLIVAGPTDDIVSNIYSSLNDVYPCTNQGEVEWLLGIKIIRNKADLTISLSQEKYIVDLIDKYSVVEDRSAVTPWPSSSTDLSFDDSPSSDAEIAAMKDKPYRSLVGSLLWLAVISRPDIMVRLLRLAKFQSNPGPKHWDALLYVLTYVANTRSLALTLGGIGPASICLSAFSDSNYNKDNDCKSTSGLVTSLGGLASISWESNYQSVTALSTTEAEYMALGRATQEVLHLRSLVAPLRIMDPYPLPPTTIWCDNSSAICLTDHEINHGRSKHINVRYHFIRDYIKTLEIAIDKVPSAKNRADMLTKYQSHPLFLIHRALNLGITE